MINRMHSLFHRPERGWDPVPPDHAEKYAESAWKNLDVTVVDQLEQWLGSLKGKRVLDLGGGPGQYSVAFAQRGAKVTWHDISRYYLRFAQQRAEQAGVDIEYSLGYLEDAKRLVDCPFDLVFNRICWYYCMNDRSFAQLVYRLVKPGGAGYVDTKISKFVGQIRGKRKFLYFLYARLGWKIGHPYPPPGRIARLLYDHPIDYMIIDSTSQTNDRVFFIKSQADV